MGGELCVESEDYAVIEDLLCECVGDGGGAVCVWGGFTDDEHAGEVFEHATWVTRDFHQSSTIHSNYSSTVIAWSSSSAGGSIFPLQELTFSALVNPSTNHLTLNLERHASSHLPTNAGSVLVASASC